MDAVTPKSGQKDAHSHVVRPADMERQKTRFPGCEAKTLLFDKQTGVVTALMRFAPGAILPDHAQPPKKTRRAGAPPPPPGGRGGGGGGGGVSLPPPPPPGGGGGGGGGR